MRFASLYWRLSKEILTVSVADLNENDLSEPSAVCINQCRAKVSHLSLICVLLYILQMFPRQSVISVHLFVEIMTLLFA